MKKQSQKESREVKEAKLKLYLHQKVNPLFERLITELLAEQPEDVVHFTINWMNEKGSTLNIVMILGRKISKSTKQFDRPQSAINPITYNAQFSDSEEDEEDPIEDLPIIQIQTGKKNMRTSVSAEAYGKYHKKEDFVARVIQKSEEQKERIRMRLMHSFMFIDLDDKDRKTVIDAMKENRFISGDIIIKEGDDGDNLYVLDQGECDCFRKKQHLKTYHPGESFGELALLYNAPRAATIIAKNDTILFALDRETFNNIVKDASIKRRERYESVLSKIELLSSMDPYERTHLCDGLKTLKAQKGDYIIRQGEQGDKFFMIEEGSLTATKEMDKGQDPIKVYEYKSGDYFGELSLIRNVPRQANVIAETDCTLVYLDSLTFKRLLGPIEDIMKRNLTRYEKYWKEMV